MVRIVVVPIILLFVEKKEKKVELCLQGRSCETRANSAVQGDSSGRAFRMKNLAQPKLVLVRDAAPVGSW